MSVHGELTWHVEPDDLTADRVGHRCRLCRLTVAQQQREHRIEVAECRRAGAGPLCSSH
jgi:hypothetical protein